MNDSTYPIKYWLLLAGIAPCMVVVFVGFFFTLFEIDNYTPLFWTSIIMLFAFVLPYTIIADNLKKKYKDREQIVRKIGTIQKVENTAGVITVALFLIATN